MRPCGMSSRATFPTAMHSAARICRAGPLRRAGNWRKAWLNTWSSTCSPRRAPVPQPRRSSRAPRRNSRAFIAQPDMTAVSEHLPGVARAARRRVALRVWLDRESVFSWLMMAVPLLFLASLVGYPFVYGMLLSLQDRPVAQTGSFVGFQNFVTNLHDPVFWQVAVNTFIYTGVATVLKMDGGLGLALAMNQHFRMKNLVRALLLLPFIVPTVLSTVAWMWMLDPAFSVVNRLLVALGWPKPGPSWLGDPTLAMISIIIINTWRGLPFYGITLLAGLQTVPPELYEAATIDGAGGWQRFRFVTLPLLRPIILIVTLFSVIFTFADFQLVYVLTHGGPQNATNLFATYAFDIAMGAGQLGLGASIALAMLPALAALIVALTLYMRRN